MFDEIYEFPTIAKQGLYELPLDCKLKNVEEVTRNSVRCRWARDAELMGGLRYFNGYGNTIGLFPTPRRDGEKIQVFYKKTPRKVKLNGDPIEIQDEWIYLLVYSIVADMASSGSNPDIEVSNNYTMKYNNLLNDSIIDKYSSQPFYPKTKDNKRPPICFFRRGRRF